MASLFMNSGVLKLREASSMGAFSCGDVKSMHASCCNTVATCLFKGVLNQGKKHGFSFPEKAYFAAESVIGKERAPITQSTEIYFLDADDRLQKAW